MCKTTLLLIFQILLLCNSSLAEQTKPVIGVSTELTGEAAAYGLDIRDMVIFANEKLTGNKYKLDFQDDKCDPKSAVDVAKYFTEQQRPVAVLGYGCSGPIIASAPIFEKAKLLTMVIFASSPKIADSGDYIFRSMPSDRESGALLANWVIKSGKRKIGVLSAETDYCQEMKDVFVSALKDTSRQVEEEDYLRTETDFKPYLLKLKRAGVEGIFLNAQSEGSVDRMLKDLSILQWKPQIYCAYFPSSPALIEKAQAELEGAEFVDLPTVADVITSESKGLYEEYKVRFGDPRSVEATFVTVFEGFRALHLAIESGNANDYLLKAKFNGIFGEYSFDKKGEIQGLGFVIKKIVNGKSIKL